MNLDKEHQEFAKLIARHEREVQAYIFANVLNWDHADEIWQETSVRLWLEFSKYESGSNFAAWATRVAHFEILTWRKKGSRNKLVFDQSFVDAIESEQKFFASWTTQARLKALDQCLERLTDDKKEILSRFYRPKSSAMAIAEAMNCSVESIYKSLQRIRKSLRNCIEQKIAAEELL